MSYHDSTTYWERWRHRFLMRHSGKSRFVQNGYPRKEPDQVRADWRERKGFKRDKAKRYWRRGCPRWLKRQCNKEYRAWQRDLLNREKFEEIGTRTRKDFYDPWLWS